jgi:dTDP-4-amino-4,6-dideoxygalactose transaminase
MSTAYRVAERPVGSPLGEDELAAIRRVFESGQSLSWGSECSAFVKDFCAYTGAPYAAPVSSCTAALHLCAQVLRLRAGDEVVCTSQTIWSTTVALLARGVAVRFADIDPATLNIDPRTIEAQITPRTKAIYVVHYAGNPCDMDAIRAVADAHGLPVVEDCAHALGAEYQGRKIGTGDLCCFSFQSLKNITTGEGGMLTSQHEPWVAEAAALSGMGVLGETAPRGTSAIGPYAKPEYRVNDHAGISWDEDYTRIEEYGTHYRLSAVNAAIGRVQLRKVGALTAARARVAQRYTEAIRGIPGLRAPAVASDNVCAWHLYPCFVEPDSGVDRDTLIRHLETVHGVQIVLRFWPLHVNAAFRAAGHRFGECPACERVWFEQQLNLPIHPAMPDEEIDRVIEGLADGMRQCTR